MTDARTLTVFEARWLGTLAELVVRNAKVRWYDTELDRSMDGILRYFCVGEGGHPGPDDDVRDANVRITTLNGFEYFMPVGRAVDLLATTYMAETLD